MADFAPPASLTTLFSLLSVAVAAADVLLVRRAAEPGARTRWTVIATIAAAGWLALHAAIASSGLLEGTGFPPPAMPYLAGTVLVGIGVAASKVGRQLAGLPLALLVGLMTFRLPLEVLLHRLFEAGALPVQMTWSGYNFDVLTAISALLLTGVLATKRDVPDAVVWLWNVLGSVLLVVVVTIALLSAPLPLRQFHNEPAVVLVFHAPYNWIVNVHVWTALVGHLVIFRALWRRRAES